MESKNVCFCKIVFYYDIVIIISDGLRIANQTQRFFQLIEAIGSVMLLVIAADIIKGKDGIQCNKRLGYLNTKLVEITLHYLLYVCTL